MSLTGIIRVWQQSETISTVRSVRVSAIWRHGDSELRRHDHTASGDSTGNSESISRSMLATSLRTSMPTTATPSQTDCVLYDGGYARNQAFLCRTSALLDGRLQLAVLSCSVFRLEKLFCRRQAVIRTADTGEQSATRTRATPRRPISSASRDQLRAHAGTGTGHRRSTSASDLLLCGLRSSRSELGRSDEGHRRRNHQTFGTVGSGLGDYSTPSERSD